uniref:Ribosomal protein S11 n=1 Tax=Manihot esculenta TaxID=3983 RepID=A0A2C9URC4_MANES
MWCLRRLSSSSLLGSYGGFKCISYMPSRFSAFSPGGLDNGNSSSRFENVSAPYLSRFQNSAGLEKVESGRNSNPMDFVRGIIEHDNPRFSQYNVEHNADIVHMKLMRNNSFISVTDSKGNTKLVVTSGSKKVVGDGKATRYAAEATAEYVGRKAREMGLKSVVVKVEGFTYFRRKRQAIMSFKEGFCNSRADRNPIVYIEDTTRRAHNGCRLPKKRRI